MGGDKRGDRPQYLEDGIVLAGVLRVISLQQAAAHRGARACKLSQVQVSETELEERKETVGGCRECGHRTGSTRVNLGEGEGQAKSLGSTTAQTDWLHNQHPGTEAWVGGLGWRLQ